MKDYLSREEYRKRSSSIHKYTLLFIKKNYVLSLHYMATETECLGTRRTKQRRFLSNRVLEKGERKADI